MKCLKNIYRNVFFVFIFVTFVFGFCKFIQNTENTTYHYTNIKIYKDTPVYDLARAINQNDEKKIVKILNKNTEFLDYKEDVWDMPLLLWAVGNNKYKAAEILLKYGADPNIQSSVTGEFPLYRASGMFWQTSSFNQGTEFVKLLLDYGADINKPKYSKEVFNEPNGTTSLMEACKCMCYDNVRLLVENGADINLTNEFWQCAAQYAMQVFRVNQDIAKYLIAEKHCIVTRPYKIKMDSENKNHYLKDMLKTSMFMFPLNSKAYKIKMEIVKEFENQGVKYESITIPDITLSEIKEHYPNNWEEYIKKF